MPIEVSPLRRGFGSYETGAKLVIIFDTEKFFEENFSYFFPFPAFSAPAAGRDASFIPYI